MGPEHVERAESAEPSRTRLAWRRAVILVLPVLYVAGTAVKTEEPSPRAWLAIAIGLCVALFGAIERPGETPGRSRDRLWTSGALALTIASAALTERWAWVAFAREIALIGAGTAAVRSIGAIDADPGLAARATEAIAARGLRLSSVQRVAMIAVVVAWGAAAFFDALAFANVAPALADSAPIAASAGGAIALFLIGATALLVAGARRLELGAPPRALACTAAVGIGLITAIAIAITTGVQADAAAALGSAIACPIVVAIARSPDALVLARRGRRALTLACFGGPVAMLAALAGEGHMAGAGLVALAIALATLGIGAASSKLEEPFLPAKGRLLDALADATRSAHDREARSAIAKALVRLREAAGHGAASPELWILHPTRICTVDAAGYLQERPGELPPSLLDVARGEPAGTVRVDVLEALEVRRPDLRPLLRWLEARGALFATLVAEDEDADGFVIVPSGSRTEPLTIEEIHAAKRFADAFVAVCQARSARERHLERERALVDQIEKVDDELAAIRHAAAVDASRNMLASSRLARPATVGIYSAASRMAYDALERRIQNDAPVVVVARAGIDPVPYLARAHLSGPRKERPLVIVDGTSSREHDLERWRDERTSPIALADRGLLVLVDGAALPRDIQVLVARALSERRPPWERAMPLDVAVALTTTASPDTLVEDGLLAPELYARFEDGAANPIELARLSERSEDLFSIVADRLAREGLRVRGKPIGIDAAAFARLVEHPFEGEDHELASIVTRLVAHARGDVIRPADMDAIGLTRDGDDRARDRERDVSASSAAEADVGARGRRS
ncbi:MAG: two component, sigma54 specific, transcriptional regulator, Fis family [Labilithrix sp.]|nr:two component, sigma54 specific, transcriptional regulator, Fis family [Labilithrix sp.]